MNALLTRIFVSPAEPRLRAGWRLLIQTVGMIGLMLCLALPIIVLMFLLPDVSQALYANGSTTLSMALSQFVELFVITASVFLARRLLDRRSIGSLGLQINLQTLYDLLAGIIIAGLMMGFIYLLEWSLGWLRFEGFAWQMQSSGMVTVNVLGILLVFVLVGWSEELLSRGYHLQTIASGLNLTWGVILSSAVFAILHLGNPNSEARWFVAGGIFLAGVFLAYGYLATKQLWLPIGLHIGWNFFEGVVFGFPVSGMEFYRLTHITVSGPELWTGGAFGPEAGLVALPGLVLGAVLVYGYSVLSTHH